MASSSSSPNWVYDVFVSFRGADVPQTCLSHFKEELDRKSIKTFVDEKIEKGQSVGPVLKQAIRTSKIAVVVFSENYASSSWCLDELVEIVKCKEELDQVVVPIFYGLDPTHVRKQTGKFGEVFAKTCQKKSENEKNLWRQSLIKVGNLCGNHFQNWTNEEEIVNDVFDKILNLIPRKNFGDFVGMEDHIAKMVELLHLESQEVRTVGIWGSSGIGKTSIARTLYSQLSHRFQRKIFIDKGFVSSVMKKYENANPYDPNVKLHFAEIFLSEILDKKDIKIDSFNPMREMLKHHKVLIFIDDLDHLDVLDILVGETRWFGCGSRIIVITKDRRILMAHRIDHIYEVRLPSDELALKIFCKSAFGIYFPPDGLMEFASKISLSAGNLPFGLHVLGSYVKGIEKDKLIKMLPDLLKLLHPEIEKTLRPSYDGLLENDKAIFRLIACLFNGERASDVKLLLAGSNLGLRNLVDKALIHIRDDIIKMHSLLQKMGKKIVRAQSNEPGEREFLIDTKDICDLLENNTGTNNVLGIALDMEEQQIHELCIHERAFEKMRNLRFLKIYTKYGARWSLPEGFDYLPQKLRLLALDKYPRRCMPSRFCPENLVKLKMPRSKLEKLWEGVQLLGGLKSMNLSESGNLTEIPDLSKATNLEKLILRRCKSLVVVPSTIGNLQKLETLEMTECTGLEVLPVYVNLSSLKIVNFSGCSKLTIFPKISRSIKKLYLDDTAIEGVPCFINNFSRLTLLKMCGCKRLRNISPKIFRLTSLMISDFSDCGGVITALRDANSETTKETLVYENTKKTSDFQKMRTLAKHDLDFEVGSVNEYFNFRKCFGLDEDARELILRSCFKPVILPGSEVPTYFKHRASGDLLTVTLPQSVLFQDFLRFKACVMLEHPTVGHYSRLSINVFLLFNGVYYTYTVLKEMMLECETDHLVVFSFKFQPMDLPSKLDFSNVEFMFLGETSIKGCGVQLLNVSWPRQRDFIEPWGSKKRLRMTLGTSGEYISIPGGQTVADTELTVPNLKLPLGQGETSLSVSPYHSLERDTLCVDNMITKQQDTEIRILDPSSSPRKQVLLADEVVSNAFLRLSLKRSKKKSKNLARILAFLNLTHPSQADFVGLWGMAGIGKTSVAREIFEMLAPQYDICYFLEDFYLMRQKKGLRQLREDFFSKIFKEDKLSISPYDIKKSFMRDRFHSKRILVVLDDVTNARDAETIVGGFDWFSHGHRIILTSRKKQVLVQCKVKEPFEIQKLCQTESFSLCKLYLSEESVVIPELMSCSSGIPLVLNVFGSSLSKKDINEMKVHLQSLRINPSTQIEEAFQRSYKGLDENEKNIFLDLACFFRGEDKDYVVQLLNACGFLTSLGIWNLVDESLISLLDNKIDIPVPFQDIGRFIVNQENKDPCKRSRLWDSSDIENVLKSNSGTEAIEGIFLDASGLTCELSPTVFSMMYNLRLLKFYCSTYENKCELNLSRGLDTFPDELRLLHWENYPLECLPIFDPENLVEVNMPYSNMVKLWEETNNRDLKKLKKIKLSHSRNLIDIGMLSEALNLEHIDLEGCTSLVDVSTSIPRCGKLVSLNMKDCSNLRSLPSMVSLTSLKHLNLSGCTVLEVIKDFAPNLQHLYLAGTAIRELLLSTENLCQLVTLDLEKCIRLHQLSFGITDLRSIVELKLSGCTSLESLPQN